MITYKRTLDLCPVCQQRPLSNWDCPYCRAGRVHFRQFCQSLYAHLGKHTQRERGSDEVPFPDTDSDPSNGSSQHPLLDLDSIHTLYR
jgi:hypothetical protein